QPNIVITISIHLPDKPNRRLQEFQVLGNQPLTALRDAVYCLSDFTSVGDRDLNTTDRKTSPSFFFFENVFYLDYRSGDRFMDYSDPIIQWANSDASRPGFQSYRKGNMESTFFQDLSIRLNYPYSFMHQGDCEHIVIFRDVRLHHPTDFQSPSSYPHLTFQSQIKRPRCFICNDLATQHVTYNDKFVGDNPCYWCEPCFIEFHYDSEDKILYRDFMWFTYLPEEFDKIGDQSRNRIGTAERSGDGDTVAETGE
ncbi:snRNA-activating protein of 50kDa MW C terminal-domain-containing protein, partial [Paraphysoderma sedebokerense]